MIDSRFLRSTLFLFLFSLTYMSQANAETPVSAVQLTANTQNSDGGFYGKIFNTTKVAGTTHFLDTGRAAATAWGKATNKMPAGYQDGSVIGEYSVPHGFNFMGGGLAIGYNVQETRLEFEALLNAPGKYSIRSEEFFGLAAVPGTAATAGNKLEGVKLAALGPMQFTNFAYTAYLLNLYHDFDAGQILKVFVGGGIGLAKVTYNLPEKQKMISMPVVAQGKIGISFDVNHLRKVGAVPYLGYTARYFTATKAAQPVTDLGVIRIDTVANGSTPTIKEEKVSGVNFLPIANHLTHNIELGLIFSLKN